LQDSLGAAIASRDGQSATLLDALEDVAGRTESELAAYPEHAADLLLTVGTTYRSLWKYKRSIPPLRRALSLYESAEPLPELKIARTLSVLGTALTSTREPEAVELQTRALAIRQRLLGDEHPDTAQSKVKLGYALHQAAETPDLERAHALMTDALATYRRLDDSPNRDTGSCIHNLAYLTRRMGRHEESRRLYREAVVGEAIPLVLRIYGDERARPLMVRRVRLLLHLERPADAERAIGEYAASALRSLRDAEEIDPRSVDRALRTLKLEGAISADAIHATLDLSRTLDSDESSALMTYALLAGRINLLLGNTVIADEIGNRIIDGTTGAEAKNARNTNLTACELLGLSAMRQGNLDDALIVLEDTLARHDGTLPVWRMDIFRTHLGMCFAQLGRFDRAEAMLREAYENERKLFGLADFDTQRALRALIDLYERSDREGLAKPLRAGLIGLPDRSLE